MKHTAFRLLTALLMLLTGVHLVLFQEPDGLFVDAGQELGAISPYIYGSNHGPWAAVPVDLLPAARDSGITFLRFPGGNWGDENDIAPWHLDLFMTLCNLMGAEPSIHVRLENGTPEKAAELVRYANIEKAYDVRYWAIGNEPNLFADYDTEQFNRDWRAIAEAMLAVDSSILLLGPELSQYPPAFAATPKDVQGRDWMTEFLRENGDLVDVVSIHRYPLPTDRTRASTVDELLQTTAEWDQIIPNLRALIRDITGDDLPVAVTEVNSHWSAAYGNTASPDSFYNALWLADVLGRLIRQQVDIVAHFTLQSPNAFGGWGLLGQIDAIRPSYYVYQLYQQFGSVLVHAESNVDGLSVYAARTEEGSLTILAINLTGQDQQPLLRIAGLAPDGPAQVWRLDDAHNAELLASIDISSGSMVTLPGYSITLIIIPALQ